MELQQQRNPTAGSMEDTYKTRYRINRILQKRHLARDVLIVNCFPCVTAQRTTPRSLLTDSLRSVAMHVGLSTVVLSIGVCKEAFDLRQDDSTLLLHRACTFVETFVAVLQVIVQAVFVTTLYVANRKHLQNYVISEADDSLKDVSSGPKPMDTWVKVYIGFTTGLVVFMLTSHFFFQYVLHQGWTLLSNNFCLIVMTATSVIHQRRVIRQAALLREDEQKMAAHEALLLLDEAKAARHQKINPILAREEHLRNDVAASALFAIPDYVTLTDCAASQRASLCQAVEYNNVSCVI